MQLVANPSKEHREKMCTIADLSKRVDLLKASLGLHESQDGDLQVAISS